MVFETLDVLKATARRAGNYLRETRRSAAVVGVNASGDTSKIFDVESEEIIFTELRRGIKDCFLFVSEESGVRNFCKDPRWVVVVDPVDGSINYEAAIPWVSISLAVAPFKEDVTLDDVVYATVYDLFRGVDYSFDVDEGVTTAGASVLRNPKPPSVVLGYFEAPESYRIVPEYWSERGSRASLRSLGSAALDIVYVGLGNAEAFIDTRARLRNVDVAAALRIATALGAKARVCGESDVNSLHLREVRRVECLLVGYDESYLERLTRAHERAGRASK